MLEKCYEVSCANIRILVTFRGYAFSGARFNGPISFFSSGNLVGYNIPQIYNDSLYYSTGTLALYIVGTYSPYYGVGQIYGTQLYVSSPFQGLLPSYSYNNDSGVVAFSDAPTNYTNLWVGLYEFNGVQYILADYQNIPVERYFTIPIDPPLISTQPTGVSAIEGQSFVLTVSASGEQLTYQWYKNGSPIAGANSASLDIQDSSEDDSGIYYIVISNSSGSVNSSSVIVDVLGYDAWIINHFSEFEVNETNLSLRTSDADSDGISNLMEYALGKDPRVSGSGWMHEMQLSGETLIIKYLKPENVKGISYRLEYTNDYVSGSWDIGQFDHQLVAVIDAMKFGVFNALLIQLLAFTGLR